MERTLLTLTVRGPETGSGDWGDGWQTIYQGTAEPVGRVIASADAYVAGGPNRSAMVFRGRDVGRFVYATAGQELA